MFHSTSHALAWAYIIESMPIIKMSSINHMRQIAPGVPNILVSGLTPQEIHAQSAAIIGMVERLPDLAEREFLKARFGRRVSHEDLKVVVYRGCAALGVGLDKTEAVYRVMKGYFGDGMTGRQTRRVLGCRHEYAVMAQRCLYETLDIINSRAMSDMKEVLERHELIEGGISDNPKLRENHIKELIRLIS
jgi:hypothetical protein